MRRRVLCPACGPKLKALSWNEPYSRFTRRFEESVARLCKVATHKHVAAEYSINRKTVKNIEKRYLQRELGPIDLKGVELLTMDEFTIQKGHRYATVIIDPTCKKVLWLGRGRSRAAIHPFFELLGKDGCKRIKAWPPYNVMKADLKELWRFRDAELAQAFWKQWYERAIQSGIEPLIKFANRLSGYIKGIVSHARRPLHTA